MVFDLRDGDSFMVLDTCGSWSLVPGFLSVGVAEEVIETVARVSWGSTLVSAQGGQYKLCWCRRGSSCISPSQDFGLEIGTLTIEGPHFNQATCVAGQRCVIDAFRGQDITDQDQAMILDTCGVDHLMGDLTRHIASLTTADSYATFGIPGTGTRLNSTQATANFGAEPITWFGGVYRLCWCRPSAGGCASPADFLTSAGEISLVGPSPNQHRTCISGRACPSQLLTGYGVSGSDRILLLETCGVRKVVDRFFAIDTGELAAANLTTNVTKVSSGVVSFGWGSIPITTEGGSYRMCWCSEVASCSEPHDFRIDIGELTIMGAGTSHAYTCVSGLPCQLDGLTGEALGADQHLAILSTCGATEAATFLRASDGVSFSASTTIWPGGTYRLCWCSLPLQTFNGTEGLNSSNSTLGHCSKSSDFLLDAGEIMLLGPSPRAQRFTCVTGATCQLDTLSGVGLSEDNMLRVMDTCAVPAAAVPRMPLLATVLQATGTTAEASWGDTKVSAPGGLYRLCWCSGLAGHCVRNSTNVSEWATQRDECFNVDVGEMQVLGPAPLEQDRTCVSGQACMISSIAGTGVDLGSFLIQETCGISPAQVVPRLSNAGLMDSMQHMVSFGTPTAAGGVYRLCWAPNEILHAGNKTLLAGNLSNQSGEFLYFQLTGNDTNATNVTRVSLADWLVDVGQLHLIGPAPLRQDFTCTAGMPCDLRPISGHYLGLNDSLILLETCGATSPVATSATAELDIPRSGSWVGPQLSEGSYRLCWCAGPDVNGSKVVNSSRETCVVQADFRVDIGQVWVQVPEANMTGYCTQVQAFHGGIWTWEEECIQSGRRLLHMVNGTEIDVNGTEAGTCVSMFVCLCAARRNSVKYSISLGSLL